MPVATPLNFPAGAVQHNTGIYASGPGGTLIWDGNANQRAMMARLGVRSAAGGEVASFWSPVSDDNVGLYVEEPSNGAGTVSAVGTAVTGVGTAFAAGDVAKLLLITSGGAPSGQANLITARASTTAITLQEGYSTDPSGLTYKLLSKIIQRSNSLAQTTVNDVNTWTFAVGNNVLWMFYNNDGATQAALKLYTNCLEVSGLSFFDVGVETW